MTSMEMQDLNDNQGIIINNERIRQLIDSCISTLNTSSYSQIHSTTGNLIVKQDHSSCQCLTMISASSFCGETLKTRLSSYQASPTMNSTLSCSTIDPIQLNLHPLSTKRARSKSLFRYIPASDFLISNNFLNKPRSATISHQ